MKIQVCWPVSANVTPENVLFGFTDGEVCKQDREIWWVATIRASTIIQAMSQSASLIHRILDESKGRCSCTRAFVDDGEGEAIIRGFNEFLYFIDVVPNDREFWAPDDGKTIRLERGYYLKMLPEKKSGDVTQSHPSGSSLSDSHVGISELDWARILKGAGWRGRQTKALLDLTKANENRPVTFAEMEQQGISRQTPYSINLTFRGRRLPFCYRKAGQNSMQLTRV